MPLRERLRPKGGGDENWGWKEHSGQREQQWNGPMAGGSMVLSRSGKRPLWPRAWGMSRGQV